MIETLHELESIKQLQKWIALMMSSAQAEHYANTIREFKKPFSIDVLYEFDGLIAIFAITYGRMFNGSTGTVSLTPRNVFKGTEFFEAHKRLIDLRNDRYAHHGTHEHLKSRTEFLMVDDEIVVNPTIEVVIPGIDFHEWCAIARHVNQYIRERVDGMLEKAGKDVGMKMRMPTAQEQKAKERGLESTIVSQEEFERITGRKLKIY